jgi:hypothetical protein
MLGFDFLKGGAGMLRDAYNQNLYIEYHDVVIDPNAKQAFSYMIGWAASLKRYDCFPSSHGVVKDFRFMRGEDWEFAFIPNQKWLLFYFRRPCLRSDKYTASQIRAAIPNANETPTGELTVRIANLEDAIRVSAFVES